MPFPRVLPSRLLLPLLHAGLLPLSGCLVAEHGSLATPLDTTLTFQSAFARGDEVGEYRCLSPDLKGQITMQGYGALHERFFEPLGYVGRCLLKRNSLDDNLVRKVAQETQSTLWFSILGRSFGLSLVTEPMLQLRLRDEVDATAIASMQHVRWRPTRNSSGQPAVSFAVSLPARWVARLDETGLGEAELFTTWRINALYPAGEEEEEETMADAPAASAGVDKTPWDGHLVVEHLEWNRGATTLGYTKLHLTLPLTQRLVNNLLRAGRPVVTGRFVWKAILPDS